MNDPTGAKEELWLTPKETAELLKVSTRTVQRWLQKGELEGRKIGNVWRVPRNEVSPNGNKQEVSENKH